MEVVEGNIEGVVLPETFSLYPQRARAFYRLPTADDIKAELDDVALAKLSGEEDYLFPSDERVKKYEKEAFIAFGVGSGEDFDAYVKAIAE